MNVGGERMKTCSYVGAVLLVLFLSGTVLSAATCPDVGIRVSGEVVGGSGRSGSVGFEGALGFGKGSIAGWGEMDVASTVSATFGGALKLTRDWLSLALVADSLGPEVELALQAVADPPAWLLRDSTPTVVGGASVAVSAPLTETPSANDIVVSPHIAAVLPVGRVVVTPSAGLDVALDAAAIGPEVRSSHLTATVDVGTVLIDSTGTFAGFYEAFSSVAVSIRVPDCGLTVSGSLVPTGGGFVYRVHAEVAWGAVSLLRKQVGEPGTICTGDVCY
jgi:hypothetical protein